MKIFKIILICLLMTLGFLTLSCAPMWTIQFDLDDEFESSQLKGWILEPELYSAKNSILDETRYHILNEYMISLNFKIPDKKKINTYYDIDIDSIKISMKNYRDTVLIKGNNGFYSGKSQKWMSKSISFVSKDILEPSPNKTYRNFIPEDVDSLVLEFDAILKEAEYFTSPSRSIGILLDNLRIIKGKEPIIVPMKLKLHKYLLKM